MRQLSGRSISVALSIAIAVLLTKGLYASPEFLPASLRSLGKWLVESVGSDSAESNADIELAYVFLLCCLAALIIVSCLTLALRKIQKRL